MGRVRRFFLAVAFGIAVPTAAPAAPDPADRAATTPLTDVELAGITGKFLLPNGVELALAITSDTVVNGQAVLRTVLTLDQGQQIQVFGRGGENAATAYRSAAATQPVSSVAVSFDRHSGIQSIVPVQVAAGGSAVSVNAQGQDAASLGLVLLPVAAGGPAVATADGLVSLSAIRGGTQVTLAGDQFGVAHLLGSTVATALVNSGNDRTFDTVTNVAVDLRNALPYQLGSAAMRVDTLALEATRGMLR